MILWVLYIGGKFYHFSLFLTVIDNSGTKFGSEISKFGSEIFLGESAGNPAYHCCLRSLFFNVII